MTTPEAIITEARSWLGTRFHHQGRVKAACGHKGGCDCLGLILGVAAALDLRSREGIPLMAYDSPGYGRAPDGGKLRETLARCLHEIPVEAMRPADVLLFRFEDEPQHVGLMGGHDAIIHCYASARKVVEHGLDTLWRSRIVAAYRFDGVEGRGKC